MRVNGKSYRTIWVADDGRSVDIIDQTRLPHRFVVVTLRTVEDAAHAIKSMQVRGAPSGALQGPRRIRTRLHERQPTRREVRAEDVAEAFL